MNNNAPEIIVGHRIDGVFHMTREGWRELVYRMMVNDRRKQAFLAQVADEINAAADHFAQMPSNLNPHTEMEGAGDEPRGPTTTAA